MEKNGKYIFQIYTKNTIESGVNIPDSIIRNKQNEFLNSPFIMKESRNTIEALDKKTTTGYECQYL